jgi:DNA-binding NarL/FixJ family response regulator
MLAEGLVSIIEPEFEVIKIVKDGRALISEVEKLQPDVLIVDISMPLLNGIEAVECVRKVNNHVKIIFLTMHSDFSLYLKAREAGGNGYVLKHSAPHELLDAIQCVLDGKTYITKLLQHDFITNQQTVSLQKTREKDPLTKRQREVLQLLSEGYVVKEVASFLNISQKTVEYHKYQMMKELDIRSVAELVRYAIKHNIVIQDKDGILKN